MDVSKDGLSRWIIGHCKSLGAHAQVYESYTFDVRENDKFASDSVIVNSIVAPMVLRRDFWSGRVYSKRWTKKPKGHDSKSSTQNDDNTLKSPTSALAGKSSATNSLDQECDLAQDQTTSHMGDESLSEQDVTLTSSLLAEARQATSCESTERQIGERDKAAFHDNNRIADTSDTTSQNTSALRELSVVVTRSNAKKQMADRGHRC